VRISLVFLLLIFGLTSKAQLFDHPEHMKLVKQTVDLIYNLQPEKAERYIDSVQKKLPIHPVVPLMRAMNVFWKKVPDVSAPEVFETFANYLEESVRLSNKLDGGRQTDPEAIFFEITARGLLAEHLADAGFYMKAISEASKVYGLMKKVSDLTAKNPEFYVHIGVYNYFREKYPERHPVYKPLIWFFKSGDVDLGLFQIKEGCKKATLTKVEGYLYLSYIYMRYEEIPELAQRYMLELRNMYPDNYYVTAKYLESLVGGGNFDKMQPKLIDQLLKVDRPYFQLAGNMYKGLYTEKVLLNKVQARGNYEKCIALGDVITERPNYYLSEAYLGMSRLEREAKNNKSAIAFAKLAMDVAVTKQVSKEAKKIILELE
jgi:hypothetical protein